MFAKLVSVSVVSLFYCFPLLYFFFFWSGCLTGAALVISHTDHGELQLLQLHLQASVKQGVLLINSSDTSQPETASFIYQLLLPCMSRTAVPSSKLSQPFPVETSSLQMSPTESDRTRLHRVLAKIASKQNKKPSSFQRGLCQLLRLASSCTERAGHLRSKTKSKQWQAYTAGTFTESVCHLHTTKGLESLPGNIQCASVGKRRGKGVSNCLFTLHNFGGVILHVTHPVHMHTHTDQSLTDTYFISHQQRDSFDYQRLGQGKCINKQSLLRGLGLFLQLLSSMTKGFLFLKEVK